MSQGNRITSKGSIYKGKRYKAKCSYGNKFKGASSRLKAQLKGEFLEKPAA